MGIRRASIGTTAERTVSNQSTLLPSGGAVSTGITTVVYTDSNYNTLTANAAATTYGTFRILGNNLSPNANVLLANTSAGTIASITSNTTYVNTNEIRANVSVTAGNYALYVFNPNGSAAIYYSGVTFEPYPIWTATSYSSATAVSVQLLTSSTAVEQPITYSLVSGTLPTGTTLAANGLISGTATGITGSGQTFTFTVSATDIYNETTQASISLTISLADQYFDYTTLLLNGETNSPSYLQDLSTNNFALTPYGLATSNRFNPYWGGYYGNYFDGSTGYITAPLTFSYASDFCIELWFNTYTTTTYACLYSDENGTVGATLLLNNGSSNGQLTFYAGTTVSNFASTVTGLNNGLWHHVAITRSGSTLRMFVDGVLQNTGTYSGTLTTSGGTTRIGNSYYSSRFYGGYISNFRMVGGTAVYTSAFTPSTTPLTAIANTSLLTCQSSRFIDNSTNSYAVTLVGSVQVVTNQPFGAVSSGVQNYGSVLFDGSTGYITSSSAANIGTNPYTIEGWFYITGTLSSTSMVVLDTRLTNGATSINFALNSSAIISYIGSGNNTLLENTGSPPSTGVWYHFAIVRNSSNATQLYINGVAQGSPATDTTSYSGGITLGKNGQPASGNYFQGYLSNFRIVVGTAVYTTNFTPSTTPLTAVANTALLTLQNKNSANNNVFYDEGQYNYSVGTLAGNPAQGTFTPFSQTGWSNYFGGSGYMSTTSSSQFVASGNGFTTEAWVFYTAISNYTFIVASTTGTNNYNPYWFIGSTNTGTWRISWGDANAVDTGVSIVLNAWNHVALVMSSSGSGVFYVNGVSKSTTSGKTLNGSSTGVVVADGGGTIAGTYPLSGYVSNVRYVSNSSVYTGNFTPPTSPLTAITNTQLLTCQSNRFIDNSTNNFALTLSGSPQVQAFSPFAPGVTYSSANNGGSIYFNGSSKIGLPVSRNWYFGQYSGTFTVECWLYQTASPGSGNQCRLLMTGPNGVSTSLVLLGITSSNQVGTGLPYSGTSCTSTGTFNNNCWNHIAICSNAWTVSIYINGVLAGGPTAITSQGLYAGNNDFEIGYDTPGTVNAAYTGYMSGLRITANQVVYSGAFTPPTAPPTPTANTLLLLSGTNSGIQDATGKNDIITYGSAKTQANTVKYGSGALYFDGSGGSMYAPTNPKFGFGTGNFTIEFWLYLNATTQQSIVSALSSGTTQVVPHIYYSSGSGIRYYVNGSDAIVGGALSTGTWYHIAVCRSSGSTKMFINGTQTGSTYTDSNNYLSSTPIVLGDYDTPPSGSNTLNGYIDDLRVTNGIARYTTNFTPPTSALLTQ